MSRFSANNFAKILAIRVGKGFPVELAGRKIIDLLADRPFSRRNDLQRSVGLRPVPSRMSQASARTPASTCSAPAAFIAARASWVAL